VLVGLVEEARRRIEDEEGLEENFISVTTPF
jgi:hypothetical protein